MHNDPNYLKKELHEVLNTYPQVFEWLEQGALDGIWYWDLSNNNNEWLSPEFKSIFGQQINDIPFESPLWHSNILPDDLGCVVDHFNKHIHDRTKPCDQIVRYGNDASSKIWVRCRGLVVEPRPGFHPTRMVGAWADLTSLVETRNQLAETQNQLDTSNRIVNLAIRTANIGVWIGDATDNSLVWNDQMFKLYGNDKESFSGETWEWSKRVHPEDLAKTEKDLYNAIANNDKFDITFRIITDQGEVRHIKSQADVIRDKDNNILKAMGTNLDITEQMLREAELKRSNEELEYFAYVASHDLKSPLRGIKQLAGWIEEDLENAPKSITENLNMMKKRITRMENLLNDMLSYARAGKREQEIISYRPWDIIKDTFDLLDKPSTCLLDADSQAEFSDITGFLSPFEQVIRNLLSNAIKHNPNEQCKITISAKDKGPHIEFSVQDNGPGIPEEFHDRIFGMFETLQSRDKVEGSGIGLATVKKIVHRAGGNIWLRSITKENSPGEHGTTFYFLWPKVASA